MKSSRITFSIIFPASVLALALVAQSAYATPFTITSQLTGDPRTANPDNLIVDVTIDGNDTSNIVTWLVDINSPLHTDIKLDAFYFNMAGLATLYSFSAFSPSNWAVSTPANNAAGSGGADFMFVADRTPPGGDVTNSVNLSFTMTRSSGNFLTTDFTSALDAVSSDTVLGSGQLGAHLQSLTQGTGNTTDSGFAFGDYAVDGGGGPQEAPEPGVLLLMGAGLMGLGLARRRKLV